MKALVADSSVILKWFHVEDEQHRDVAVSILESYRAGGVTVSVPPVLFLEILNVAATSWRRPEPELFELVESLEALDFDVVDIALALIVPWTARGLTAYDASYVALAQRLGTVVVTDDRRMLAVAPGIAVPLATFDIDAFLVA